tara:strand:+ start:289 stop:1251 length:963 start_codon:yes stop_codon:yes gene_type:complete
MNLLLSKKIFSFELTKILYTSTGEVKHKKGWLINIKNEEGFEGWGEISPLSKDEFIYCKKILETLGNRVTKEFLEDKLKFWPKALGFGFGGALAELDLTIENKNEWLKPPESAFLLDSKNSIIDEVNQILKESSPENKGITFKIKLGLTTDIYEQNLLYKILRSTPNNTKLRIDVNGGWSFEQAKGWVQILKNESKIEWIEQPLPSNEIGGLLELSKMMPIALDESLIEKPSLIKTWRNWQIRRPLLEGDPRLLLKELQEGTKYRALSTSFETGIGKRWIDHLAALQKAGPTPTAPGLAPGWCPNTPLFSSNPKEVWRFL